MVQLRYWLDGDDIRTASDVRVDRVDNAVIYGIQKNYLYRLRVLGFSAGGDGTMSELIYFTLGENLSTVLGFFLAI
jgi:hypothetical protein